MAALTPVPKIQFFDANGHPLAGGKLYSYSAGTTTPLVTYTDQAGTSANTNPVILDARGEASVWLGTGPYKLRLTTATDVDIWTVDDIYSEGALSMQELLSSAGSSLVGFIQSGTGATYRTVQSKLRDTVSVKDFGAVGDGVTDDTAAIQAAFNSGAKSIHFPSGTYYCGQHSTATNIFDLSSYGNGLSITTDAEVELICQTTALVIPAFFKLTNNSRFTCGNIRFRDTGYDPLANNQGACGFLIQSTGTAFEEINIASISANEMTAAVIVQGAYANRVKNINIGSIFANDCYYGYNGINQGDAVKIGAIYSYSCLRPVFIYGITGFETTVYNYANRATSGAINISRSIGGYNTEAIKIRYVARDCLTGSHVFVNHLDLLGGTISNVDLDIDIEQGSAYTPVSFANYNGAGVESSAPSSNVVADITIKGRCDSNAGTVTSASASYATFGILNFYKSQYLLPNPSLDTDFDVRLINDSPYGSFTPLIEGLTTAGVGTYTTQLGRYQKIGNRVFVDIVLTWTAHTGTGNMRLNLNDIPWSTKNVNSSMIWSLTVNYSLLVTTAGKQLGIGLANASKVGNLLVSDPAGGALALVAMDTAGTLYISGNYETSLS